MDHPEIDCSKPHGERRTSVVEDESLRDILIEMRESEVAYVVALAKRISLALNRDCYCPICGRILGHKPSEEWYDKAVGSDVGERNGK